VGVFLGTDATPTAGTLAVPMYVGVFLGLQKH